MPAIRRASKVAGSIRAAVLAAPDTNHDGKISYQEDYNFLLFRPESVNSYEVGWKAALFDRRLTFALDGFYADYKDVQIPGSIGYDTNGDGINDTFIGITTNAAKATMKGIEFEGNAVLARDFAGTGSSIKLAATAGLYRCQVRQVHRRLRQRCRQSQGLQNTPKWTRRARSAPRCRSGEPDSICRRQWHTAARPISSNSRFPGSISPASLCGRQHDLQFRGDRYSIGVHAKNIPTSITSSPATIMSRRTRRQLLVDARPARGRGRLLRQSASNVADRDREF